MAAAVIFLAGCKTTGYQKHDAASVNSQDAAAKVRIESQQLEVAIGALNELVNQTSADAKPQFKRFSAAVDRLTSAGRSATNSINRMWRKRTAYFQTWDKEIAGIQDEEIRRRSQERRTEVSNLFDSTSLRYDEAQNNLTPVIGYLRDIRTALSADLTREGLASAQPAANSASTRATAAQSALAQLATELDTLSHRTSTVMSQAAK